MLDLHLHTNSFTFPQHVDLKAIQIRIIPIPSTNNFQLCTKTRYLIDTWIWRITLLLFQRLSYLYKLPGTLHHHTININLKLFPTSLMWSMWNNNSIHFYFWYVSIEIHCLFRIPVLKDKICIRSAQLEINFLLFPRCYLIIWNKNLPTYLSAWERSKTNINFNIWRFGFLSHINFKWLLIEYFYFTTVFAMSLEYLI